MGTLNEAAESIAHSPPNEHTTELFRRVGRYFIKLFRGGIGIYVLTLILLTTMCICGRYYLHYNEKAKQDNESYTKAFLQQPLEPEEYDFPGVVTLALMEVTQDVSNLPEFDTALLEIMDVIVAGYELYLRNGTEQEKVVSEPETYITSRLGEKPKDPLKHEYLVTQSKALVNRFHTIKGTEASNVLELIPLRACDQNGQNTVGELYWPDALCAEKSNTSKSATLIPRQRVPLGFPNAIPKSLVSDLKFSELFEAAIGTSLVARGVIGEDVCTTRNSRDVCFEAVQSYFISSNDLLRIYSINTNLIPTAPRTKPWTDANYYQNAVNSELGAMIETKPYVDFGGNGIVFTRCKAQLSLKESYSKNSEDQNNILPKDRLLRGVVCVDYALKEEAEPSIVQSINAAPFLVADYFTTPKNNIRAGFELKPIRSPSTINELDEFLPINMDRSLVAQAYDRAVTKNEASARRKMVSDGDYFFLPLGEDDSRFRGVVISVDDTAMSARLFWSLVVTIALAAATFCFLIGCMIFQRPAPLNQVRTAILQNLKDAVVLVNNDDVVLEVNDRADELFGVKLPKPGSNLKTDPMSFAEFIDTANLLTKNDSQNGLPYRRLSYEHITNIRRELLASIYYARLRNKDNVWVQITAKPFLTSDTTWRGDKSDIPPTFGVVEVLDSDHSQLLTKILGTIEMNEAQQT